ncbi:MAG: hypothetical protein WD066_05290 [Planctomycetaceae bacterium]
MNARWWVVLGFVGSLPAAGCSYDVPAPPPKPQKPVREGILDKTTREVLDLKQALADNPDYEVLEGDLVQGNNPVTQAATARIGLASEIMSWPIEQFAQFHYAERGRFPTHAEVVAWMDENPGVTLQARREYDKYAYDADTGRIVMIQDTKLKRKIFEAEGIRLD